MAAHRRRHGKHAARPAERLRNAVRGVVLLVLVVGPLGFGAVHEEVFVPILTALYLAGAVSWAHGHWARATGHPIPRVPGARGLLALHALVVFQLLPVPPFLLRLLSPGSHAFYAAAGALGSWRPVTVSPELTLRGLAFLVGMTALYATCFREFRSVRWRHRLAYLVVATGFAITVVALLQSRSADPRRIYGFLSFLSITGWKPEHDWAVFGPYVNGHHFAGLLVMAIALSLGIAMQRNRDLALAWEQRRRGWLALFDPPGLALLRWLAIAMVLIVGLALSGSRAGLAGLCAAVLLLMLLRSRLREALRAALVLAVVLGLVLFWADFSRAARGFATRGIWDSRVEMWVDQARLIPRHALLGVGFNALGPAYRPIQTYKTLNWFDQAHNEYLQIVLDTGLVGAAVCFALLWRLFRTALRTARQGPIALGLSAAILGSAANNLFDFNWQIPANAAAFIALAGLVMGAGRNLDPDGERDLE